MNGRILEVRRIMVWGQKKVRDRKDKRQGIF